MSLVVPNVGEKVILDYLTKEATTEPVTLKLYSSNTTPGETDTAGTYTECTGSGYAAINMVSGDWTVTQGAPSDSTAAEKTFTFTGALGNVYGYYVIKTSAGTLVWAERFSGAPFNIQNNGDQIKITLKITCD